MTMRRYVAPDMRTALAAARREQGGDVIIVGRRAVEGGLELITAEEYDEALLTAGVRQAMTSAPPMTKELIAQARAADANGMREVGTARSETLWTREPVIEQMREELRSLRGLLHDQLSSLAWRERPRVTDDENLVQRAFAEGATDEQLDGSEVDLTLENLLSEENPSRARA